VNEPISPVPGPQPGLAALVGEVAVLRQAVDALAGLPAQIRALAGVVTGLTEPHPDHGTPPAGGGQSEERLPSWLGLSGDFADAVTVLGELATWLHDVYLRYSDAVTGLPECWLWHPDVVEELLWLRAAWAEAYRGDTATAAVGRAADWHDRQRPGVVRRIKAVAGTCSLEAHQPGGERHRGADPVPLAEAIHTIGEWWALDRDAVAPAPDAGHLAAADALRRARGRR
jgi:hypothetical protein